MALPINIEDLLNKRKVESNRIEFKSGWNPVAIYRSICAFANDYDNIGGGYILVGVEENNGIAQRPVKGIPEQQLDKIQREIVQYNQLIEPFYAPRLSVEEIDGQNVLVIWVPSGINRPYAAPTDVTARQKKPVYYIRYGTSSVEAKGEQLDELRDMANRVPFDDRGNPDIKLRDISSLLLRDYLIKVDSKLQYEDLVGSLERVLEQMDLYEGPSEKKYLKNVAAMMFCETPEKFFRTTQVDIVVFPEGREKNPDNIVEPPVIKGSVPMMINKAMSFLRTNVVKERIRKLADDERSLRYFNYPYQALEEAVVNAVYHRDYREREPVEITIEPDKISILSHGGPDRSIPMDVIHKAQALRCRKYRNRRLGEFLKELGLTEGRATGIPTIQKKLKDNGSAPATIETDEDRSYFLIDIPCHPDFVGEDLSQVAENLSQVVSQVENSDNQNINSNLSQVVSQVVSQVELTDKEEVHGKKSGNLPSNMATSPSNMATSPSNMATSPSNMATSPSNMATLDVSTVTLLRKKRLSKDEMRRVVIGICRSWVSLEEIATILNKNPKYLRNFIVPKLLISKEIEMLFPNNPNHPRQKYKAREQ